ncbi:MAG: WD40 repeat domain-containing protein [Bacteroidetes bacterium]|nr:MAG: WD40 repeat domain-containing protein [Bacteroidota bacterium]
MMINVKCIMKNVILKGIIYFILLIICTSFLYSQVNFIRPRPTDTLLTGRITRIEWNNAQFNSVISLFYSNNEGSSWQLIADSLSTKFYNWQIPLLDTLKLKFRIVSDINDDPELLWEISNAHNSEVRTVSLSADGRFALSSGGDSLVKIWDISSKAVIDSIKLSNQYIYGAYQFHGIDSIIIAFDSSAILWDRINHTTLIFGKGYFQNIVKSCAVNPAMSLFEAGSYDGYLMLFSVITGDTIASFHSDDYSNIYTCSFSNDGTILLFSTYSGDIYAYDVINESLIRKFDSEDRSGSRLVWSSICSSDNKYMVTGCVDGLVRIYDMNTGIITDTLKGHTGQIRQVNYNNDERVILSGSLDGTMRQWYVQNSSEATIPINHGAQVLSCGYSSTSDTIISAGRDGSIKLWKNFKPHHYEDSIVSIVKYPLKVKIPDIYSKTGEFFRMQLLADELSDIPKPQEKFIDYKLTLEYPSRILDFRDSSVSASPMNNVDTAIILVNSKQLSDTLANFLALSLFGSEISGNLNILDFKVLNSNDYHIDKDDGSITLSSTCEGNTSRQIQFSKSALAMTVYPQPAEAELKIDLNILEKGRHILKIYDEKGNVINDILDKNFSAGLQHLSINTGFLEPGIYFLVLIAPSEFNLKYFVIVR